MYRRTPSNRPIIRSWASAMLALAWLLAGVFGAPTPLAVAQPAANDVEAPVADDNDVEVPVADDNDVEAPVADDNDVEAPVADDNEVEVPTPSPSDLFPPVVVPDEEPEVAPPAPVVDAPPAYRPVQVLHCPPRRFARCRPRLFARCRPRVVRCRPVLQRRVVCTPCPAPVAEPAEPAEQAQADPWQSLFDGQTLKHWKPTEFGGQGKVEVRDGMIVMEMGHDMTGVTFAGKPPQTNYELQLQAQRLAGHDFFCTTTFPVGEEHCSLVVGGWGGTVVGLSSIDFYDASDNLTTTFHSFEDENWYDIRIRVSDHKITAWIGGDQVVRHRREGHRFGVRFESEPSRPLGFSTWQTTGAVRNIRLRNLTEEEVDADQPEEG